MSQEDKITIYNSKYLSPQEINLLLNDSKAICSISTQSKSTI